MHAYDAFLSGIRGCRVELVRFEVSLINKRLQVFILYWSELLRDEEARAPSLLKVEHEELRSDYCDVESDEKRLRFEIYQVFWTAAKVYWQERDKRLLGEGICHVWCLSAESLHVIDDLREPDETSKKKKEFLVEEDCLEKENSDERANIYFNSKEWLYLLQKNP